MYIKNLCIIFMVCSLQMSLSMDYAITMLRDDEAAYPGIETLLVNDIQNDDALNFMQKMITIKANDVRPRILIEAQKQRQRELDALHAQHVRKIKRTMAFVGKGILCCLMLSPASHSIGALCCLMQSRIACNEYPKDLTIYAQNHGQWQIKGFLEFKYPLLTI